MIRRTNFILMAVFVALLTIVFVVRRDYTARNVQLLPGMVDRVSYPALSATTLFANGTIMQPPVPGTIVRGFAPLPYRATPEDARRAGEELHSPITPVDSAAAVTRGAAVFATRCAPCHGTTGTGDGLVAQRGFPPPPSLFAESAMKLKDGQMFHIITFGQKNMPSLASQVRRDDRWNVIAYIRSLQSQYSASTLSIK